MRFDFSFRGLALGVATATFLAAGTAWALPAAGPSPAPDNGAMSSGSWLAGGTARLDHALNSQTARQGEKIEARLDHTVKTPDGTELPTGTELWGAVTAVQASQSGSPASIAVRFDKAELKDGRTVPVKVTVTGAFPNDQNQLAMYGQQSMGPAQRHVSIKDRFDQEPGTLSHVAMMSNASGNNSARFSNQSGDVKLSSGTYLQLGIARNQNSNLSSGA